jgi:hypothetical protein
MPGHGQFAARERERRATVSLAAKQEETEQVGLSPFTPLELLRNAGLEENRFGALGSLSQATEAIARAGVELGAEAGQSLFNLIKNVTQPLRDDPLRRLQREEDDPIARAILGDLAPGGSPDVPTPSPSGLSADAVNAEIATKTDEVNARFQAIVERGAVGVLDAKTRFALDQQNEADLLEIEGINEDIETLNRQLEAVEDIFAWETQILEGLGLPPTVAAFREDEELAGLLDDVTRAVETGVDLDEALDALAEVGEDELDQLGEAFGRERYLADIQRSVKTQLHNLVENRQQVEAAMVAAEDWEELEKQAIMNPLWDMAGNPSISGRGEDAMIAYMDPWMDANFIGTLSTEQGDQIAGVLKGIWRSLPSARIDEVLGIDPATDMLTGEAEILLMQLATVGNSDIQGLNFTEDKAIAFVEQMKIAVQRGIEARALAEGWATSEKLNPGMSDMATGIWEVAIDAYDDPEDVDKMANSPALHRIIQIRSDGVVGRVEKDGNQFGIGNLPEHTYEYLGYTLDMVEDNPEEQIRALILFIGEKYGPSYQGVLVALSELIHNPDAWGEPPSNG